jgi:hypothetical protein
MWRPGLPRPALLLVVQLAGPPAPVACKGLQDRRSEAMRDPAFTAGYLLQRLQRWPSWPACSHCHRKGVQPSHPRQAGSLAIVAGYTSGCGGPLLRWCMRHAPKVREQEWVLSVLNHVVLVDRRLLGFADLEVGRGQSGQLLSLLLSGVGCGGAALARISAPVRAMAILGGSCLQGPP